MIRATRSTATITTLALLFAAPVAVPASGADPSPESSERSSVGPVSPVGVGQRVEMPEASIALSFPWDWTEEVRTVPFGDRSVLPGPQVEASMVVNAYRSGSIDGCRVSLWRSVGMTPAEFAQWSARLSDPDLEVTPITLAIGVAFRISVVQSDPNEPDIGFFIVGVGENIAEVTCMGADPPDDRWLSVADTFEILPPESPSSSGSFPPSPSTVGSGLVGPTTATSPCDPTKQGPSGLGLHDCWRSARAHAVALVLATDPRFVGLRTTSGWPGGRRRSSM